MAHVGWTAEQLEAMTPADRHRLFVQGLDVDLEALPASSRSPHLMSKIDLRDLVQRTDRLRYHQEIDLRDPSPATETPSYSREITLAGTPPDRARDALDRIRLTLTQP